MGSNEAVIWIEILGSEQKNEPKDERSWDENAKINVLISDSKR